LHEETDFIWFSNRSENLKHLINNWLSFLHDERIIEKKVLIETVSESDFDQVTYLSFNQSPLDREWSIYKKWNFIESLLKTIRGVEPNIKQIVFLVGYQQMEDDHLDFSQNWPIEGFE